MVSINYEDKPASSLASDQETAAYYECRLNEEILKAQAQKVRRRGLPAPIIGVDMKHTYGATCEICDKYIVITYGNTLGTKEARLVELKKEGWTAFPMCGSYSRLEAYCPDCGNDGKLKALLA